MKPGALGEGATKAVLHALTKPVVGLDVLPCYIDFCKAKNVWGVAIDDLSEMAVFFIIVVGEASVLDAEDAETVFVVVAFIAVETACVEWVGRVGWEWSGGGLGGSGGHNYALSPFGEGVG